MTWDEAVERLPPLYAAALRLQRVGADDAAIAASLGVEEAAVPITLEIAEAKLRRLLARGELLVAEEEPPRPD